MQVNAALFKNYRLAVFIALCNFILVCFAVQFKITSNSTLDFALHDNYVEVNFWLYYFISTLMLLFFNVILMLLKQLSFINITLKLIVTIIIAFPMLAILYSVFVFYNNHLFSITNESFYTPGIFLLLSGMMTYRLVQIYSKPAHSKKAVDK